MAGLLYFVKTNLRITSNTGGSLFGPQAFSLLEKLTQNISRILKQKVRKKMKRPLFEFTEFQAEYPLSKELPYWDFLEGNGEECAVLADGSLVQGLRLTGVDLMTLDTERINHFTVQLRSVLNSLPDGVEVQFFVDMNSDYSELISEHEAKIGKRPLVSWITAGRVGSLRAEMERQLLRRCHLYAFFYSRIRNSSGGLSSFFEQPKQFAKVKKEEHEKRVNELRQSVVSFASNLEGSGIHCTLLSAKEMEALAYGVLNPVLSRGLTCPMSKAHREQEFTPEEFERSTGIGFLA